MGMKKNNSEGRKEKLAHKLIEVDDYEREIREKLGFTGDIYCVNYHLSHGASAYYFSGYDKAAVMTIDGVGEWQCMTYGYGENNELKIVESIDFPDSIGLFYSAVTAYLGFEVNDGEYKIMGLAPHGQPTLVDKLYKMIGKHEKGESQLNMEYFNYVEDDFMYSHKMEELLEHPGRIPESELLQFHMDVARSVQVVIEELLLEKAEYLYSIYPCDNLCLAGGVALNCVAVGKLYKKEPFKNIFVQPAAGDAGAAIGAAAVIYQQLLKGKIQPLKDAYLGPGYSNDEILRLLDESGIKYMDFRNDENRMLEFVAAD